MNTKELNIVGCTTTLDNISLEIDINHFIGIKEIVLKVLQKLKINTNDLIIYYERQENGTSILAIKVEQGHDEDIANYMFNGSSVNYYHDKISCDVYLHAEAPAAQKSVKIAGLISRDIVNFFEELETELLLKKLSNCSFSLKIPLQENELKKENNVLKKVFQNIFKHSKKNY